MKKFLAVYLGSMSGDSMKNWMAMDEKTRKEKEQAAMQAWMNWGETYQKQILDQGAPLGKTKKADRSGISDTKNLMTGYTIIEAESHDAAIQMFKNHPHFSLFPGESVEVMEILPMPKM